MTNGRKVIIDCDPGIDDTLALMYAIKHQQLDVIAITIVAGNCPVDLGFKNVSYLLEMLNRKDIPVYLGCEKPLKREYITAQDTHGMDGLGENNFTCSKPIMPQKQKASEFLADYFQNKSQTSIIALGPLTNIATALNKNMNLGQNCYRFVSMGGSYKSHGNCSPVAEYNYWCDPDAAQFVYQNLNKDVEMIGLDVTRKIVFTPNHLEYIKHIASDKYNFISKITRFYFDFHWQYEHILGCVINDPLAIAYFINTELCHGFSSYTDIVTNGVAIGQSLIDDHNFYKKSPNAIIHTQVNKRLFWVDFLSVILDLPSEIILTDLIQLHLGE